MQITNFLETVSDRKLGPKSTQKSMFNERSTHVIHVYCGHRMNYTGNISMVKTPMDPEFHKHRWKM